MNPLFDLLYCIDCKGKPTPMPSIFITIRKSPSFVPKIYKPKNTQLLQYYKSNSKIMPNINLEKIVLPKELCEKVQAHDTIKDTPLIWFKSVIHGWNVQEADKFTSEAIREFSKEDKLVRAYTLQEFILTVKIHKVLNPIPAFIIEEVVSFYKNLSIEFSL
jgi:hypothetical protein